MSTTFGPEEARSYMRQLLKVMHQAGGSDLFISADFPPSMKALGGMKPLSGTVDHNHRAPSSPPSGDTAGQRATVETFRRRPQHDTVSYPVRGMASGSKVRRCPTLAHASLRQA